MKHLVTSTDPVTGYTHRYAHGVQALAEADAAHRRGLGHVAVNVTQWDGGEVVGVELFHPVPEVQAARMELG